MRNTQNNWIKIFILSGFTLILPKSFGQKPSFTYFDVNTLCNDAKVLALKNDLPKGWRLRSSRSNFFIERIEPVYLPKEALKSIEHQTQPVEKWIDGKKLILFKTKAYFLMTVEKQLPTDLQKNNKFIGQRVYLSKDYTFFLWQKHGYTYSNYVLPTNLYDEFRSIEKLLYTHWTP